MRVKALIAFASPVITPAHGQEFEVSDEQAKDWIKAGLVKPVGRAVEVAVAPQEAVETAVTRKRSKKEK